MSTYSGFSSRKMEDKYNNYLKDTVVLMSQIIISQIDSHKIVSFKSHFQKLQNELKKLDLHKYAQPKFSKILEPLTDYILNMQSVKQCRSQPQKKRQTNHLSNNFMRTRKASLQQARRTISYTTSSTHKGATDKEAFRQQNRYIQPCCWNQNLPPQKAAHRIRQSCLHPFPAYQQSQLTMQELMRKNPLIQRKMSAQRRRKVIRVDCPQIREEEGEDVQEEGGEQLSAQGGILLVGTCEGWQLVDGRMGKC